MTDLQQELARFETWAATRAREDASSFPSEWECDYPDWQALYAAVGRALEAGISPAQFNDLLFVLARDNECEVALEMLPAYPELALRLAEHAVGYPDYEARWQIAVLLGRIPGASAEALLARFLTDPHEYVRRRAGNARPNAEA